ncbi:hypothetical protein O6H91_12G002900 [Diphasiastrum complanatum]|uniref:Uncharacterized protein n=1 Tax=Diphasiastrum complanatum TaxID=34168 RepID=A0ACC2BYB9_DIPCM|nr:hypothetical protein O6H91_12G002900 [Diphasiastrum complanatum]
MVPIRNQSQCCSRHHHYSMAKGRQVGSGGSAPPPRAQVASLVAQAAIPPTQASVLQGQAVLSASQAMGMSLESLSQICLLIYLAPFLSPSFISFNNHQMCNILPHSYFKHDPTT